MAPTETLAHADVALKVVSNAAGRMRVHATGFRFDEVRAVAIEDSVAKVTGVCAVYAYPRTASVVVFFSPESRDTDAVLSAIADARHVPADRCLRVFRTRLVRAKPLGHRSSPAGSVA